MLVDGRPGTKVQTRQLKIVPIQANSPMLGSTVEEWVGSSEFLQSKHVCLPPTSSLGVYRVLHKVRLAATTAGVGSLQ